MEGLILIIVVLFAAWFVYISPGLYAARRGSNALGWVIVSLFLPVISWALVLILYSNKPIINEI